MNELYQDFLNEDLEYKNPYMKVIKDFKFYGLSNVDAIEDILAKGFISPTQYKYRNDSNYKMTDAIYFTDDLSKAFNWYATKRSDNFNDKPGADSYVFVIDPTDIDNTKIYFDETDFYIAILGITVYNLAQQIADKPSLFSVKAGFEDGKAVLDIKTGLNHSNNDLNKLWNKALELCSKIILNEVNRFATPVFDVLRNFDMMNIGSIDFDIGNRKNAYNDMNFRYNKPTSFNEANMMYKRLFEKDAAFREWVKSIQSDILNNINPKDLYNKNVKVAASFTVKYQKMLSRFVKNFCSSFAYRGELPIYGYFKGKKVTLSSAKAKDIIFHIGTRYLKTEEQPHSINDFMKQFNKTGLGISFKKYGEN